ncbi:MAG: NAD-dependent epimerase/dehydratase family protein [Candidatus Bathyarchaeota archaeon]|nr:NAD-dependent epimerase/dehydratase family protein [Candidatus Bathyarchaeota archaeon]
MLVTGGSGFIGSHVVDKLMAAGHDICVFDLRHPVQESVEWFKGDIVHEREVMQACWDVEAVYHLAAIADVYMAAPYPSTCIQVNEIGTLNILKAATAREVERVVLASSTWVYGTHARADEETPILPPSDIYTKTKIGQEHLLISWHSKTGLPYTVLRYGIPYGPRMRSNMAISKFVRKAMKGDLITIFGDGTQGRCFVYVEDLAEGNVLALKKQAENQVINLAGDEFTTLNDIVKLLKNHFRHLKVTHIPTKRDDFKGTVVSNTKAKKLLGWSPSSFADGFAAYIALCRDEREIRTY